MSAAGLKNSSAMRASATKVSASAHGRIRSTLVLDESVLEDCIAEVVSHMLTTQALELSAVLKASWEARASVRRLTGDVALLLSIAKTQVDEGAFESAFELIANVAFVGYNGLIGAFAKAMVRTDRHAMGDGDAYIYACMPKDVVAQRLDRVRQFVERRMA